MKRIMKKVAAFLLCIVLVISSITNINFGTNNKVYAEETGSHITSFSYNFAYLTPGYADGTINIQATEDGVYKAFWGDESGNKLSNGEHEYTYLARVVVKDGKGSFNIISDYTAIPKDAKTVVVYKKDVKEYVYNIPTDRQFMPKGEGYTFGSMSDFHYGRYIENENDIALDTTENAMAFMNSLGVDFVGLTGDLTNEGEQISLDKYNETISRYPDITVISCTGNHDSRSTVSTSNTSLLDTSLIRWYNSLTSTYFTVNGDGTFTSNLDSKFSIPSIGVSRETEYREASGESPKVKDIPALDFTVVDGDNVYIFFNEISKTGSVYDVDKLITTEQMDWLANQFETYKDKKVFMYVHSYLSVNTDNNDAVDYDNPVGDLKNAGGYSYDLDFKDFVTTSDGRNMLALFKEYDNVTMFSGHSHWLFSMQEINPHINIGRVNNGKGATLVHLPSVTEPRYIGQTDTLRLELDGEASEGMTVTVYDDCIVYNGIDLVNKEYEAYATYMVSAGENSQFEIVKDPNYKEATDVITGDEYLDAEDMNKMQLLKSTFNLTYGAAYEYTSKGSENTEGALTDGSISAGFLNTRENKKDDQCAIITLEGEQDVSNLKEFQIYFVNNITNCTSYNVQISLDGEYYETVGTYENMDADTNVLEVDTSNITLEKYKYIKLNLAGEAKTYGYQIREFAAIGYERNATPNTAGSSSSIIGGTINEEDLLPSDYNIIYGADYTQSSVGTENQEGKLTDGGFSGGFLNTERNTEAIDQSIIVDLGIGNSHSVSNIDFFLVYFQNNVTNATDFNVSVSLDGDYYESVGNYTNVEYDEPHFDADLSQVTLDEFRFVKLHLTNGNTGYGYQIKEFAVIGTNPIEYPQLEDRGPIVANPEKNLALNKPVYVSSTYAHEGTDPTVLTNGNKNAVWSSDWDSSRTSEYIIIDLEQEVHTSLIGEVLVNHKSDNTFCSDYSIEYSKTYNPEDPTEGFYKVAKVKSLTWENLQKKADSNGYVVTKINGATPDTIRYVKINFAGHGPYGYQISEVAVLVKQMRLTDKEASITVDENEYKYTGEAISPKVNVSYGGIVLTEGIDYSVTYSNNINVGEASYTVVGSETYSGTVTKTYKIVPRPLEEVNVNISVDDKENVSVNASFVKQLVQGVDYSYSSNKDSNENIIVEVSAIGESYSGNYVKTFYNINNCKMFDIEDVNYTGKEVKPTILITHNGILLEEGKDFTLECMNNTDIGTAIVIIKGNGTTGSYIGNIETTFKIVKGENVVISKPTGLVHIPATGGGKSYQFAWKEVPMSSNYNIYIDGILVDSTINTSYTFDASRFANIGNYEIGITAVDTISESEIATITFIVNNDSTTSIAISEDVKVEGYQISHILEGSRVVGSVEPTINDKEVISWGFIYAITNVNGNAFDVNDTDLYINTINENVACMESTQQGSTNTQLGESSTANYFVRTMLFSSKNIVEFSAEYKVRTYAQLEDGTYIYSDVYDYSVYDIADGLYQNKLMDTNSAHEYLYNNILTVVNSSYNVVDYNWNNAVLKPKK